MATEEEMYEQITARLVLSYLYQKDMISEADAFCMKSPHTVEEKRMRMAGILPTSALLQPLLTTVKEYCTIRNQMSQLIRMFVNIAPINACDSPIEKIDTLIEFFKAEKNRPYFSQHSGQPNSSNYECASNPIMKNVSTQTTGVVSPFPERPDTPQLLAMLPMEVMDVVPPTPRFLVDLHEDQKSPDHCENSFYPSVFALESKAVTCTTDGNASTPQKPKLEEMRQ